MKRKFYVSYVHDSYTGEKVFENARVLIDIPENNEKQIPILLQEKLSKKINDRITTGRFFPVTLINFWEIDIL
jgi:hypothetical protein